MNPRMAIEAGYGEFKGGLDQRISNIGFGYIQHYTIIN